MMKILLLAIISFAYAPAHSCTIFTGKDRKGQVWAGNNEDWIFPILARASKVGASVPLVPCRNKSLNRSY